MPYTSGVWRPHRWEDWRIELIDASLDTVEILDEAVAPAIKWGRYGYGDGSFSLHIAATVATTLLTAGQWYFRFYRSAQQIRDFMLAKEDRGYTASSQYIDEYMRIDLVPLDHIFMGKFGRPDGGTGTLTTPADTIDNNFKWLVDHVCGPNAYDGPGAVSRAITGLVVAADLSAHPTTQALDQGSQADLFQFLQKYGVNFDVDWRVRLEKTTGIANQMVFETFYPSRGADKTEGNGVRSPVIINDASGNVLEAKRYRPSIGFANVVYSKDMQTSSEDAASIALYGRHEIQADSDDSDVMDMLLAERLQRVGYEFQFAESEMIQVGVDETNDELVLNGDLETAGAGPPIFQSWNDVTGDGALADEAVIVHGGSHSLKITAGATANTQSYQIITVIPGKQYRVSVWVYGDGANESRLGIWDATNAAHIIVATGTGQTAAAWAERIFYFTAPAGCTSIWVRLICSTVNGGIGYFDDISLVEDAAGTIMPGDEVTISNQYLSLTAEDRFVQSIQFSLRPSGEEDISLVFGRYEKRLEDNLSETSGGMGSNGTPPIPKPDPVMALKANGTVVPFAATDPSYVEFLSADGSVTYTGSVFTNSIDLSVPEALYWTKVAGAPDYLIPTDAANDIHVGALIELDASLGYGTFARLVGAGATNGYLHFYPGQTRLSGNTAVDFYLGGALNYRMAATYFGPALASQDNGSSGQPWDDMYYDGSIYHAAGAADTVLGWDGAGYSPVALSAVGELWTWNGSEIEPTITTRNVRVGTGILFDNSTGVIAANALWDGVNPSTMIDPNNTYLDLYGASQIRFWVGGAIELRMTSTYIGPGATGGMAMGAAGNQFNGGHFNNDLVIYAANKGIILNDNTLDYVLKSNGTRFIGAQLSMDDLSDGHDPVTLNATLAANLLGLTGQELTLDSQAQNYVFAGPASGGAGAPDFRSLVILDMPSGVCITNQNMTITGLWAFTQNITMSAGKTVDGVDISAHTHNYRKISDYAAGGTHVTTDSWETHLGSPVNLNGNPVHRQGVTTQVHIADWNGLSLSRVECLDANGVDTHWVLAISAVPWTGVCSVGATPHMHQLSYADVASGAPN